jgi:microcompartment protein CcmL/EutN
VTIPHHPFEGPAVAMLDICDVPVGLRALDALAKEAPVQVLGAGTVQPGRFLLLFRGQVEPVQMAFSRARDLASPSLLDAVLLPRCEERILPAALDARLRWPVPGDTAGLVQTASPPTLLGAVDAALKGACVDLVELRVADGLGGKSIATLWGEIFDVQAALSLALDAIARGNAAGCSTTIIPRADDEVVQAIRGGTRFFKEWRG